MTLDTIESKIDKWITSIDRSSSNEIFEERPVPLDTFLYSAQFLNLPKLSPVQQSFIKYGTHIYHDVELELLDWDKIRRVGELVAFWGKGAGKDFVTEIIFSRIAYELLCLTNPQKYYNQADITSIDMLNMAYSGEQAESVFFKTFQAMIESCKWFSNKCEIKSGFIQFDKRIAAYSGNSFEESFEGKNLIVAALDEISAFKTKMELEQMSMRRLRAPRYSAESVFDMAKSSVESRFGNGIGKVISLSFPRFKNDYIQQLYNKGKNEDTIYVSKGATWDVNPTKKRSDFDDEFRKNPERAEARYGCNPSGVEGGYFKNKDAIINSFPIISKEKVPTTDDRFPRLKNWFKCNHTCLCSIHLDLGLKHDKAGIAMSHVFKIKDEVRENEIGEKTIIQLPIVAMDLQTSFIAPENGEIELSLIRQFIVDLLNRGFRIGKITADQFQCLTGDMKVECIDGHSYELKQLVDNQIKELWVYAVNKDEVVPAKGFNIRKTGVSVPVYKVILDNGEEIKATKEHLFMMRDGSYKELQFLKVCDSLMPLYFKDGKTYEEQYKERAVEIRNKHKCGIHRSLKQRMNDKDYWGKLKDKLSKRHIELGSIWNVGSQKKAEETRVRCMLSKVISKGLELNEENYSRVKVGNKGMWNWKTINNKYNDIVEYVALEHKNHKIVSVEFYGYEDVYDMEVDTYHNFALSSGIFVHNSASILQDFAGMGIETDNRSVDRNTDAYDILKELMYDSRLVGYSYIRDIQTSTGVLQVNEVLDELSNLILVGGRKCEHPAYGSKDVSDSVAGSVQGAIELGMTAFSQSDVMEGSNRETTGENDLNFDREYLSGVSDEYFKG